MKNQAYSIYGMNDPHAFEVTRPDPIGVGYGENEMEGIIDYLETKYGPGQYEGKGAMFYIAEEINP